MSETTAAAETVEVLFSRDRRLYYVTAYDHHRPQDWVSVEQNGDGKYEVLPFAFYDVKSGERESRPITDELVTRYALAEKWPVRGSAEWVEALERTRTHALGQLAEEQRSVAFWQDEVARLDALRAKHGGGNG